MGSFVGGVCLIHYPRTSCDSDCRIVLHTKKRKAIYNRKEEDSREMVVHDNSLGKVSQKEDGLMVHLQFKFVAESK